MASGDRFYQLELRHRPALWGDIGSLLKIDGLVVSGEGAQAILLLPSASCPSDSTDEYVLTEPEWTEWLRLSDNPKVLVMPEKAFHRKVRYEISGHVQQKIWVADGFECYYCGAKMGKVQLTIDHFIPLEMGGKNDTSNYLSACRRCNKNKGAEDPQVFCARFGAAIYHSTVQYLKDRVV